MFRLLQELPEEAMEVMYEFLKAVQGVQGQEQGVVQGKKRKETPSAFGIAHKYARPALIDVERI